jgi:hypothetical protein
VEPQAFRHQSPRRLCRGLSPPTEQVCGAQPREGRSARRPTRGAGPTAPAARPGPAAGSGSGSEMSARRATSAGGRSSLHRTRTAGSPRLGPPRSRGVGRGLGALLTSSATVGSRSAKRAADSRTDRGSARSQSSRSRSAFTLVRRGVCPRACAPARHARGRVPGDDGEVQRPVEQSAQRAHGDNSSNGGAGRPRAAPHTPRTRLSRA